LLGTAVGDRSLMEGSVGVRAGAAVGVVVAAEGYPEAPIAGRPIEGVEPAAAGDDGERLVFHAGTVRDGTGYRTAGGRIVTVVGRGSDLEAARAAAYAGVDEVSLAGGRYRRDIAARELGAA
jgi:phosphoribosylamine--glycine ligase